MASDAAPSVQPENISAVGGAFTAKAQHELLREKIKTWSLNEADLAQVALLRTPAAQPAHSDDRVQNYFGQIVGKLKPLEKSTLLKSILALLAVLVLGWLPLQRLLATSSVEAIINAHVITVRAPIEGTVSALAAASQGGAKFEAGDELLTVRNPRADQMPLLNLQQMEDQVATTVAALQAKKDVLESHSRELAAQKERFRLGRIAQLEKRVGEIDAEIISAKARHEATKKNAARARTLFAKGVVAEVFLDNADRDDRVASESVKGLLDRRNAALVELTAARNGTFIGDSYNDTPQSAQRSLAVELELAEVDARLAGAVKQLADIKQTVAQERTRYEQLSTAVIRASVSGRIWEMMTAPGEHVNAGQELMRLLDCKSAIVTASVSENDFQKLQIGQRATFKPARGGKDYEGWIVDLTGLAVVPSNNAIGPQLLSRAPYHVTLKFPQLSSSSDCPISRAGSVVFDTRSPPVGSADSR